MTRNLTFFFAALVSSMPIWWGVDLFAKNAQELLLAHELRTNPQILAAYAAQQNLQKKLEQEYPLLAKQLSPLQLQTTAALSLLVKEDGSQKVLFEKQGDQPLLIASLTKLMTSLVALQQYSPNQEVIISKEALEEQGETGLLKEHEVFTVRDLLHVALMESSNDAAAALTMPMGRQNFIAEMNRQAAELQLRATSFENPTGLDALLPGQQSNYSSANDLAKLTVYVRNEYPQVLDILSQQELALYTRSGEFHHTMKNTNMLLDYREWPTHILGGKTGYTPQAKETLLLLTESPDKKGYIINIVLGSADRFGEMRQLLRWILQSYQWNQ